jgi:hypothetical protein
VPDVVEIYICKPGQELKQGQLVVSNDIDSRDDARADAESRCAGNQGIARIAYYAISENGDFRAYFSYKTPTSRPRRRRPQPQPPAKNPSGKSRR